MRDFLKGLSVGHWQCFCLYPLNKKQLCCLLMVIRSVANGSPGGKNGWAIVISLQAILLNA